MVPLSDKRRRQAGAKIEITEDMIAAGVKTLAETIPLDIAKPVLCEEDIVNRIYRAMRAAETLSSDSGHRTRRD